MSRLLPTGTTIPLPDVGKDFPYYEVLLHYVSSFSDGRRQSAVRICDRARRRFRGARGLPGRCAWARAGRCGAGPAGWARRLAQTQQLTGKLFTSFRGPKFPDSGVVWGGAAGVPEDPNAPRGWPIRNCWRMIVKIRLLLAISLGMGIARLAAPPVRADALSHLAFQLGASVLSLP